MWAEAEEQHVQDFRRRDVGSKAVKCHEARGCLGQGLDVAVRSSVQNRVHCGLSRGFR